MPKAQPDADLPSTLKRSPKKAAATYEATLASAEKTYDGDEARAHRAAWAAVKHSFEKTGDRWEPKAKRGPSDAQAAGHGPAQHAITLGGVDVRGHTKDELIAQARQRGISVSTRMTKTDLGEALARANDQETRRSRS